MNWNDEGYVRIYRRNTTDLIAMGWEARSLFWELLRHADRSGCLEFGKHGLRGLARLIDMPIEIVERNIPVLLDDGCVRSTERGIVIPNYQPAQEASRSDRVRKAEERARKRESALASAFDRFVPDPSTPRPALAAGHETVTAGHETVTPGHEESQAVTPSHERSRNVTQCQISVPDLSAVPPRAHAHEAGGTDHGLDAGAKVGATPAPAEVEPRRFELGASAERAVEVYGDALAEALGHRVAIPSERSVRMAICDAVNVHARPESLSAGLAWLRAAVLAWVADVPADKRAYTAGWAPKRFVAWLNERGGFTQTAPRPAAPAVELPVVEGAAPPTPEELERLLGAVEEIRSGTTGAPTRALPTAGEDLPADRLAELETRRRAAVARLRAGAVDSEREAGASSASQSPGVTQGRSKRLGASEGNVERSAEARS